MKLFAAGMFWMVLFTGLSSLLAAAQAEAPPTGKVIEVHSDGVRPTSKIALRTDRSAWFWTSNFPRIKGWQLPEGQEPIQVLEFRAILLDGKAELTVSTYSGKRFRENVDVIAKHQMVEGDTVTISEVKKFGYEPLTLKMVRVTPTMASLPTVENKSQSVRVAVELKTSTLPTFTAQLVNDSPKAVWGVPWHTERDGRMGVSALAQGKYGRSLIEPNGLHEISAPASTSEQIKFVIDAVIFEDGSVEGDAKAAANFHAFTRGARTALERIVPILQAQLPPSKIDVARLIELVDATDGARPGLPPGPTKISLDATVEETVRALRILQDAAKVRSEAEVREALTEFTKIYEDWLSRLQKYP